MSRRDRILEALENDSMTIRQLADVACIDSRDVDEAIRIYVAKGWVKKAGMVSAQLKFGRRKVQRYMLGDVKPTKVTLHPVVIRTQPVEQQRIVIVRADEPPPAILLQALAARTPLELAWSC